MTRPKGLMGLQNLGNTCYMNSALQALSNCQQLTRFVLDCPAFLREKGLCRSYSDLINEIWNSSNSQHAVPTSVISNIKCIYPAFRGCTQQDTQEFLRCFLEQLHDELKQPVRISRSLTASEENSLEEQNLSNHRDDNPKGNSPDITQTSIISDTFEFRISSSVVCSSCNSISTTEETFKDLSIPIPTRDHPYYLMGSSETTQSMRSETSQQERDSPTSTYPLLRPSSNEDDSEDMTDHLERLAGDQLSTIDKSSSQDSDSYDVSSALTRWFWSWLNYFSNWFWGPQVTLSDCLSIFFGSDPLEGDNEYSCDVCTKKNRGVKYLKIIELPEVLCIHFKRYESIGSSKIMTHVSFPLVGLDLAPFMSEDSRPQCTTYDLIACICHHGSALLTGHYTTYALNCYDDQWYEFDDQYVTNVQSYQVENSEAYILFYQKSSPDDRIDRQRVKASRLLKKSLNQDNLKKYYISKQWVNKFNTFVEPGPISNDDFLCEHAKIPKSKKTVASDMCHPVTQTVWEYLSKLHGGGPECEDLIVCEECE